MNKFLFKIPLFWALFNILDGLFTYLFVMLDYGSEVNPLMAKLLEINPAIFLLFKMAVTPILYKLMVEMRNGGVKWPLYFFFVTYALIIVNHLMILGVSVFG